MAVVVSDDLKCTKFWTGKAIFPKSNGLLDSQKKHKKDMFV